MLCPDISSMFYFFDAKTVGEFPMVVKRAFIKPKQGRKRPEHREGNTYIKRQEAKRKRESYTEGAIQSVALDIT